jgi:hypothetical protein
MLEADVTVVEVECPFGNWCDSGHKAPKLFGRDGPRKPPLPMRFFMVTSKTLSGIYCELCLTIANRIAMMKKQALVK